MIKEVLVFENIIPESIQNKIRDTMLEQVPWFYNHDVSIINNPRQQRPAFSHLFHYNGQVNSDYWSFPNMIIENTAKKLDITKYEVNKSRSFLQLPLEKNFTGDEIDSPHVDLQIPHLVFLYYVCDSDGDTVIYKNKTDGSTVPYFDELEVLQKITPKQGSVVVFDGLHWHTAEQPRKNVRCIINNDIIIKETKQ